MAKRGNRYTAKKHDFRNKLLLNQWIISLFGIKPQWDRSDARNDGHPFQRLAKQIDKIELEGLDKHGIHKFYDALVNSRDLFGPYAPTNLSKEQLRSYAENIATHTQKINQSRKQPIVWKYFQWLTLIFVEIYLDRFFSNPEKLLDDLNQHVRKFNDYHRSYEQMKEYKRDDLNKICFQNATGSGKTLLMHVNLLQYLDHARKNGREDELSRTILLTPNDSLSNQHESELELNGFSAANYASRGKEAIFSWNKGKSHVDIIEITKLADQKGDETIATDSLGDRNLLLVDEGHRGAKSEEGAWFARRSKLCAKGFSMEYSATFSEAVTGETVEDDYAKSILFDYSYKWFYGDGFGKEYNILNISENLEKADQTNQDNSESLENYITACLLKYYQQLRLYEENRLVLRDFNIEKPLWVFVGSSVQNSKDAKRNASDVAKILRFFAIFLSKPEDSTRRIEIVLAENTELNGLRTAEGQSIFGNSFSYLKEVMSNTSARSIYSDILERLFHNRSGGTLALERTKGKSGEIALRCGTATDPFGLITVGETKELCNHMLAVAEKESLTLTVKDSRFSVPMFGAVKDSGSPINLLIGAKKFIEGWDCWRVSTMGLMHVGRGPGAQIIQLFGRGIRLKGVKLEGHGWSLKRSNHIPQAHCPKRPEHIIEIETLNVFGIGADFMGKFRTYLESEGLSVDKKPEEHRIPLNVTFDFGKKLKVLRPKYKKSNGEEYSFLNDAPAPTLDSSGNQEHFERAYSYLCRHKVLSDWYPLIQHMGSNKEGAKEEQKKNETKLREKHIALLNIDALYFELERFKGERNWHNLNITKAGIKDLLGRTDWYTLYLPETNLNPTKWSDVRFIQRVATELLKSFCNKYYNYQKREFIEPRLELRDLAPDDANLPQEDFYRLVVDSSEERIIEDIKAIQEDLSWDKLIKSNPGTGSLTAYNFDRHLYQPLLHLRPGSRVTIQPVQLNESELQFVEDLRIWYTYRSTQERIELYLLRNLSRGKGIGFFEAGGFYPDFILWILDGPMQYVNFIDPHGLLHEGPGSAKIEFCKGIKKIQQRLNDPNVILNSFILSPTRYALLNWLTSHEELEARNVIFMQDKYISKLIEKASS